MANFLVRYREKLMRRSEAIPPALERIALALAIGWAGVFFLFASLRILASPRFANDSSQWLGVLLPYAAIALAPLAGFVIGEAAFPRGHRTDRSLALSRWGRWRQLRIGEVRLHRLFGPAGFMASLLVGLLLNVVIRSGEFLLSIPALASDAPAWARELFLLMAADVAVMGFFYMVSFAFALRSVTLFPRMLAFTWLLDVAIQLLIAQRIGAMPGLPAEVAAPLADLLRGNIQKVLISAFVWLPYLILSERVNVTYRHRTRAD
ncbi:DUF2569 domain-containing protein [Tsuneonella amylolytica]|uniref:DUF2569 domain-containing protein n=1 Tax=Tsuneonella amylolytica TaxID=2338327 RepID=UPI000EA95EDF|nr:DUF2569 domain-containing protein [Tsuneonella amylolytica]